MEARTDIPNKQGHTPIMLHFLPKYSYEYKFNHEILQNEEDSENLGLFTYPPWYVHITLLPKITIKGCLTQGWHI
jgi:hypothetical protein